MNAFFEPVFENWPVLAALIGLAYTIIKLSFKTNEGFLKVNHHLENLDREIRQVEIKLRAEMREGFLKVSHHFEDHDREIKRIKRKLKRQP
jgi:hypothetical protein